MSFEVHTHALRTCAHQLESIAADVPVAQRYADGFLHVEHLHSGIFQNAVSVNDSTRTAVAGALTRINALLHGSHLALIAAAKEYDATDEATRERLDRTYEKVVVAPGDEYQPTPQVDTHPEKPGDYQPPAGVPGDGSDTPTSPGGGGGSW